MYNVTLGAQGQTVMLTLFYEMICGKKHEVTDIEWYSANMSDDIWEYISKYQTFQTITNVLQDKEIASGLLNWYRNVT
nr:unnamed protein product [Naegleria fowleri]